MIPLDLFLGLGGSVLPAVEKQYVGELIYHYITEKGYANDGKLTGMIIEMENEEIIALLKNLNQLEYKIKEAVKVLEEHDSQMVIT